MIKQDGGMFTFDDLKLRISAGRVASYLEAADGDPARALALYEWHTEVSGAIFAVVADIEVVLRNAIHDALTELHASHERPDELRWFDEPCWVDQAGWLVPKALKQVRWAQQRVGEVPGQLPRAPAGRVVAELSFGFWRYLLDSRYENTFWNPAIRHAFALAPRARSAKEGRERVYFPVEQVHALRNRLAHHEPVHGVVKITRVPAVYVDVPTIIGEALEVISWLDPNTATWIESRSRVPELFAKRP